MAYHCVPRVVGGLALLDQVDKAKETLASLIWQKATFCGLEVITYCVMADHFHVLVRVPATQDPTDAEVVERMELVYGKKADRVQLARASLRERGRVEAGLRQAMVQRMGDVSEFMKELKQAFSIWFNRLSGRTGTLWSERFRSVVVEDRPQVLSIVAAYIDLNPVRASLVSDPKDYPACGYAEAVAGDRRARAGLLSVLTAKEWKLAAAEYRKLMAIGGGPSRPGDPSTLDRAQIKRLLAEGGDVSLGQVLRLRVRHLTDGAILGSEAFVNEVWALHRDRFGPKRRTGARPIRGVPLRELSVLRDLRVKAIT